MKHIYRSLVAMLLAVFLAPSHATTITPIDLNDFFSDPEVTVAPDGSSAVFVESPVFSPILLVNDPGLGDPNVIIPQSGRLLRFDYDFVEGVGSNDDEFGAFVFDATTGISAGAAFEFFTQSSGSGSVSIDLTSLVSMTLGLEFALDALPGDAALDSTLTVSNVRLEDPMPAPVPATLALLVFGLAGIRHTRRRRMTAAV